MHKGAHRYKVKASDNYLLETIVSYVSPVTYSFDIALVLVRLNTKCGETDAQADSMIRVQEQVLNLKNKCPW